MRRGHSVFTPVFSSGLAPVFARYVDLKRALGRRFDLPARTLHDLDRFLCDQQPKFPDLNAAAFQAWCHTLEHVTSGVRRVRMLEVCAFCLYRRRTEPQCFVPDPSSFPPYHQRLKPHIFSEAEVARLLSAASGLKRNPLSPLRPEAIRLAIILLFTTGIRRGELLNRAPSRWPARAVWPQHRRRLGTIAAGHSRRSYASDRESVAVSLSR